MAKADARAHGARNRVRPSTRATARPAKPATPAQPTDRPAREPRGSDRRAASAPLDVPRWLPAVSLALTAIGLALAAYLTYEHYTSSSTLACTDTGVVNCLQVTTSAQSKVFGIPVALLGLLYFAAMLPTCVPAAWRSRAAWLRYGRIGAGVVGVGFVFYLLYSELFTIGKVCLYCTGVHVVTVALFAVIVFGQAATPTSDRH